MDYTIYVADVETTALDSHIGDVIEFSLFRMTDGEQKTWCLKPLNIAGIDPDALRINGHKLEDLLHQTQYGRDTYRDPNQVIVEIENWMNEDNSPVENRIMAGQSTAFDRDYTFQLWSKCNSKDSFPFGRRMIDTMGIEFFLNLCEGKMLEGYSLKNLTKKYGVVNSKAHTAAADVLATKEVLIKQIETFKKALVKV